MKRDGRQHETALHVLLKHRHKYYMYHHPKAMRILSIVTKMLRFHPHLVFLEDRYGNTPLHTALNYAYCHGKCDVGKNSIHSNERAELLLMVYHLLGRNGSTPPNPIHQTPLHVHNVHGQTPMDLAIQRDHHHCCGGDGSRGRRVRHLSPRGFVVLRRYRHLRRIDTCLCSLA